MSAEILCFDLGGTGLKCGLVDRGRVRALTVVPTDVKHGLEGICRTIEGGVRSFDGAAYEAVGFSTAGKVDEKGTITHATANLPGYAGFALTTFVQTLTGRPCAALNDGEAALLGELCGRNASGVTAMLTLGTGVGGGYAVNGKLVRSHDVGHIILHRGGIMCTCGQRGCIEAYASGSALTAGVRDEGLEVSGGADVWPLYKEGEPRARRAVGQWLDALAAAIGLLYDRQPFDRMIVGGGVSASAAYWLDDLRRRCTVRIETARLGVRAGLVGAYAYAKQRYAI